MTSQSPDGTPEGARHSLSALQRAPSQPLAPRSPAALTRTNTAAPLVLPSAPRSPYQQSDAPRRWHPALRVLLGIVVALAFFISTLLLLLVLGQVVLVARIIVGGVLVVVFGTPLLCLVGFMVLFIRVLRHGRRHQPRPVHTVPVVLEDDYER